jgi:anti-sigma28 factor (negative regulator of flagellin synthesis)
MKVVDRNLNSGSAVESGRTQETQRASATTGTSAAAQPSNGDRVEFSNTLGSLARAMSAFGSSSTAKVQALATEYQAGTYQADSVATSRAMIAQALTAGAE